MRFVRVPLQKILLIFAIICIGIFCCLLVDLEDSKGPGAVGDQTRLI